MGTVNKPQFLGWFEGNYNATAVILDDRHSSVVLLKEVAPLFVIQKESTSLLIEGIRISFGTRNEVLRHCLFY